MIGPIISGNSMVVLLGILFNFLLILQPQHHHQPVQLLRQHQLLLRQHQLLLRQQVLLPLQRVRQQQQQPRVHQQPVQQLVHQHQQLFKEDYD